MSKFNLIHLDFCPGTRTDRFIIIWAWRVKFLHLGNQLLTGKTHFLVGNGRDVLKIFSWIQGKNRVQQKLPRFPDSIFLIVGQWLYLLILCGCSHDLMFQPFMSMYTDACICPKATKDQLTIQDKWNNREGHWKHTTIQIIECFWY